MARLRISLLAALLIPSVPVSATAQQVTGRLVDETTGEPLRAAFVVLLDSAGVERAGILTNPDGRYLLRAPEPGRYTVRAELIGYATRTSPPLALTPGEVRTWDASIPFAAVELEAIEVEGSQRCTVRPGSGLRTAEVWEEARKALRLAAWTEEQEAVGFRAVDVELELDPQTMKVLRERRRTRAGYTHGSPYESVAASDLAENGYVRPAPGGHWTYLAPDARVLLSDAFLDGHCFELTEDEARPGLIGLAFRPVERGRNADIRGVLWLDRASAELRTLEFTYTTLPYPVESKLIGGQVDFDRLAGGPWIVRSWRIRMPEVALERRALGAFGRSEERYVLTGLLEVGADVRDVQGGQGTALLDEAPEGGGSMAGAVYDAWGARAVADARVSLPGPGRSVRTGEDGTFVLDGLREGLYDVRVTPESWDLPWLLPTVAEIRVREGDTSRVELRVPGPGDIVGSLCGDAVADSVPGVVLGRLTDAATGQAVPGGAVVVSWGAFDLVGTGLRVRSRSRWTSAVSDADGWYLACGVPTDVLVRVRAVPSYDSPEETARRLWLPEARVPPDVRTTRLGPDEPLDHVDLELRPGTTPRVTARVVDGRSGSALPGAEAVLLATDSTEVARTASGPDGLFVLTAPAPGAWIVRVVRAGYRTLARLLTLEEGPSTLPDFVLLPGGPPTGWW